MSKIWGIPSPTNWGPKNHLFSATSQLNGNFNGLYLWNKTRYTSPHKCVGNYKVSLTVWKCHELSSTDGFKWDRSFYPLSVNSALYFIARLHTVCRQRSANGTQPNFTKRWTVIRANNLPQKSRGHPSPKNWGQKTFTLVRFFDDFET